MIGPDQRRQVWMVRSTPFTSLISHVRKESPCFLLLCNSFVEPLTNCVRVPDRNVRPRPTIIGVRPCVVRPTRTRTSLVPRKFFFFSRTPEKRLGRDFIDHTKSKQVFFCVNQRQFSCRKLKAESISHDRSRKY